MMVIYLNYIHMIVMYLNDIVNFKIYNLLVLAE